MKQKLLKTMLLLCALVVSSSVWADEGDEITSIANIVDGQSYYIKGVRNVSGTPTTYYLTFTDATGSQSGTESSTTAGAQLITFHEQSTGVYQLETSSGNFIAPGTSNGKINVTASGVNVTASNQSSKIRLSITSGSNTWSIQKNTSAANFGGYKNTQTDITLIEGPSSYSITAVSNNNTYGTVSLDGKVITGSPNSGYRYASPAYTVTSGTATVSQEGNEFTVTPTSDCTVRINFEAIPTHTVTVTGTGGTVTVKDGDDIVASGSSVYEGTVLTINAVAGVGKVFMGWDLTNATPADEYEATTTFTMGTSDVTVEAVFDDATTHAITYSVNGATTTVNVVEDEDVDLSAPASGVPTGYTFKGWRTSTLAVTDTDPNDYVTSATSTADITYYAVVAKVISSTPESWTETALASLTSSDIFVFSNGSYALNNDGGTSNAPSANSITVSDGKITSAVANKLKWNVTGNATDGYTFYPNGSTTTWLYCNTTASSSSNNNIRVGTGDRKVWKPNGSGYLVTNDTYTDRYLSIYSSQDFRGYVNDDNAFVPKFYKYIAPVPTYGGYCTTIPPVSVTVGTDSYATFASDFPLDFTDSDIKAYIAKGKADYTGVTFTQINKVPANTGVLLYKDGGTTENIPVFAGAADATTGNVFVRGTGAAVASVDAGDDNLHNYILNKVGGVVGFYKAAGQTVATNRAYIQIDESKSYSVKEFIALPGFDDDADGIKSLTPALSEGEGEIYNLAGQRLSKMQKGINIVNGKKILY